MNRAENLLEMAYKPRQLRSGRKVFDVNMSAALTLDALVATYLSRSDTLPRTKRELMNKVREGILDKGEQGSTNATWADSYLNSLVPQFTKHIEDLLGV